MKKLKWAGIVLLALLMAFGMAGCRKKAQEPVKKQK